MIGFILRQNSRERAERRLARSTAFAQLVAEKWPDVRTTVCSLMGRDWRRIPTTRSMRRDRMGLTLVIELLSAKRKVAA